MTRTPLQGQKVKVTGGSRRACL